MFCYRKDDPSTLSCGVKLIPEIISLISIIFSIIVVYITAKYTKLNIINNLILQILISEIIDGINILLVIFEDMQWPRTYENYYSRRGICFSQIFLSLFVCLWTLISSFFISLRIYDITGKKNMFKKKIMKKVNVFTIFSAIFVSFWFWVGQTYYQAHKLAIVPFDNYYQQERTHHHFRHIHCWYETNVSYAIFAIALCLIIGNIFFSVKGILVMRNIKVNLTEELDLSGSIDVSRKKSEVESVIRTLWIYPVTSAVLWLLFIILQIFFDNEFKGTALSIIYVILISVRQPIYALVFLFTQRNIKKVFINFFLCKNKKKDKSKINPLIKSVTNISDSSDANIINN